LENIEASALAAGLPLCGNALTQSQAEAQFDRGYRMVAGFDVLWLRAKAAEIRDWCKP